MSEDHEELVKIRQKVEDLEDDAHDRWHQNRADYENRIMKALEAHELRIAIFLAIDGARSAREIIKDLKVPQKSAWRAFEHLRKKGIFRLVKTKKGSPVYAKKPWVKELDLDEYVKERFPVEKPPEPQNQTLLTDSST